MSINSCRYLCIKAAVDFITVFFFNKLLSKSCNTLEQLNRNFYNHLERVLKWLSMDCTS